MITPASIAADEAALRFSRSVLAMSDIFIDVMSGSPVLLEIGIAEARKVREAQWQGGPLPRQNAAAEIGRRIRRTIERSAIDNGNAGGPAMDAALTGLFDYLSWDYIGDYFHKEEVHQW